MFDSAGKPLIVCEDLRVDVCTDPSHLDWTLREIASRIKADGFTVNNFPPR